MSLLISLRSELLKTKRTAAFYFTLAGAAIVPVTYLFNVAIDGISETKNDPFNAVFKLAGEMNALVFFPWFVILICTLMPQIEYKNNTWKQVFASPQAKATVFLSKFLGIHVLFIVFLLVHHLLMFIAVVATHFIMPELDILNQPLDVHKIVVNNANIYITVLAIAAIQFWLGLRFKNFIVPIGIGLALWFAGTFMVFELQSVYSKYFPYSFQIYSMMPKLRPQINQVEWTSLGYSITFLVLGFIDFNRRRIAA
ncbi:ABC transporter permease [Flavitalea antarctica]